MLGSVVQVHPSLPSSKAGHQPGFFVSVATLLFGHRTELCFECRDNGAGVNSAYQLQKASVTCCLIGPECCEEAKMSSCIYLDPMIGTVVFVLSVWLRIYVIETGAIIGSIIVVF